ncbi:hypothetical protein A2997_01075 [Candidatus Nomurabacteria bacterium RIFCSPLOWO2_01_FULL_36_10b]|uniref:Peptidase M50 domain-containing protein n=1 Tax=Candidatus Nomurabacteria bacterium RIFCSPLOWO2_01_FULL_36_10b TaxID=1801766 RepID=A0A1F6WPF4_9BACT|nr:MAG: hypothetical protein A2997_01075 [Candidatus Nomurabacteria bacterium RIFCSPLOWO2_01_FULL_36_10b]
MSALTIIVYIIVLFLSVIIHEVAHGYAAEALGDPTARMMGRLTLNPFKHIDIVGSILLPLFLVIVHSPILLGWAKPVPFNPLNFKKHRKWGGALVALAGPSSNIVLALVFAIIIRISPLVGIEQSPFMVLSAMIVLLNIVLAIFNLLPAPPLDGHHVLFAILPNQYRWLKIILTRYSIVFFFIIFFIFWGSLEKLIMIIFKLLAGNSALLLLSGM